MSIEDKELDLIYAERQKKKEENNSTQVAEVRPLSIEEKVEQVNNAMLRDPSMGGDKNLVKNVQGNLKDSVKFYAEVEKLKAENKRKEQQKKGETIDVERKAVEHDAQERKWANREKRREFAYNGVKPIMEFVGINSPLNLFFLYLFTLLLAPIFLVIKLLKATIGTILAGAEDGNRTKFVKGFVQTVFAVFLLCVLAAVVYLFLKWQKIINIGV